MKRFSLLLVLAAVLMADLSASAFYNSATGRWLSRDPMGERAGRNLYALCRNRSLNSNDRLGREENEAGEDDPIVTEGDVLSGSIDGDAVTASVSIQFKPSTANSACYATEIIMSVKMSTTGYATASEKEKTTFTCSGENSPAEWSNDSNLTVECKTPVSQCPSEKQQGQFTFQASFDGKVLAKAVLKWDYTCANCCELKDGINHSNSWFTWDPLYPSGK